MGKLPVLSKRDLRFADKLARENLRQRKIKPGSTGYARALKAAIDSISYESFHHSLSPGEGLGENPSTPAIPEKVFSVYPDLAQVLGDDPLLIQRFRGTISLIAQMYCDKRAGLKKKMDFSFHAGQTKTEMKKAEENQYYRIFVATVVMALMEKIFEMDPDRIWEILRIGGLNGMSLEALKKAGGRESFARTLKNGLAPGLRFDVLAELRRYLAAG